MAKKRGKKSKGSVKKAGSSKSSEKDESCALSKGCGCKISCKKAHIIVGVIIAILVIAFLVKMTGEDTPVVEYGDAVNVWYVGKLESGEIFDTNVMGVFYFIKFCNLKYNFIQFLW